MTVVFLNALVDLGHKILIQNTVFKIHEGPRQVALTAIVNALILLPFIVLFSPSGYLSDRFDKTRIMRASSWVAVFVTSAITICYYAGWFWLAFAMTFLLAVQSAIYSPAKYGYVKELLGNSRLAQANGFVQAMTMVAILTGTFVFSVLFERIYLRTGSVAELDEGALLRNIAPLGFLLIAGSLAEVVWAYRLPSRHRPPAQAPAFAIGSYLRGSYLKKNLGEVYAHRTIWLSIVGLSIFWAVAQVVLAAFPAFAEIRLMTDDTRIIQGTMVWSGIGIMLGSMLAGRASRTHIELGLIPLGALGVAAAIGVMPLLGSALAFSVNFFALGVLGGLFLVPLNALIQFHAGDRELGRVLAANNFVQNCAMLLFLLVTMAASLLAVGSLALLLVLAVVAVFGAAYTIYKLPQSLVRFLAALVAGSRYRLEVVGFDNLPERGGVLLLGNHVSWIDWAVLQMACPRPIRFVMHRGYYELWYLKWFLDFFGAVPIGGQGSRASLESIRELLNAGEIVCLFPEGTISRSGQLAEFQRGYETAALGAAGKILPFHLRGLWGSRFSRSGGMLRKTRRARPRRKLIVAFGSPLPMETLTPELKRRVLDLSIRSWQHYTDGLASLPSAFLRTVKRRGPYLAVADWRGATFDTSQLATAAIRLSRFFARESGERIALLLPTSSAGAMANLAVLFAGKTVVNLNYTAGEAAIRSAVERAGVSRVFSSRRFLNKLKGRGIDCEEALAGTPIVELEELAKQIGRVQKALTFAALRLLPFRILDRLFSPRLPIDHPAAILFSSGSEAEPKGVVLSHRNIVGNLTQTSDVLDTERDDVMMSSLPLFHAFGLTVTTFMPLIEGVPMICHPDPTDGPNIAKAVATYRATILCATSTFLRLYTRSRRVHPLMFESLRIVVAGAERLRPEVRDAFELKFKKEIYEGYGATETTPVASVNIPDRLDTRYWKVQRGNKPGTVGLPLPGTSFRIVDPESLEELPVGEDGLILVGGTQIMLGYLDDPQKTAEVIVEIDGVRWYKSGDKGHLDEDGFLTIVDRYSRFAKLGGEMVSLSSVEDGVRQALDEPELELVAVNLPDEKKGERVVVLVAGEGHDGEEIRRSLIAAGLEPLSIPARVLAVGEIPKLGSGKTDFGAAKRLVLEVEREE